MRVGFIYLLAMSAAWSMPTDGQKSCTRNSLASMAHANRRAGAITLEAADHSAKFFDICSCKPSEAFFSSNNMRESGRSSTSDTIVRQRAFVLSIVHVLSRGDQGIGGTLRGPAPSSCLANISAPADFTVYNTEAHGQVHALLSSKFGAAYTASEYVSPTAEPGSMHHTSSFGLVRHEDLRALSFPSNSFDLVMSAEVFEHIPEPYVALAEVFRVLKPGGSYLWTVPLDTKLEAKNVQLSMLNAAGKRFDRAFEKGDLIKSPQFHGDPLAPEGGIVVFQVFGAYDLLSQMCKIGFELTRTHNIYSTRHGIVAPYGVMTMVATKPKLAE